MRKLDRTRMAFLQLIGGTPFRPQRFLATTVVRVVHLADRGQPDQLTPEAIREILQHCPIC